MVLKRMRSGSARAHKGSDNAQLSHSPQVFTGDLNGWVCNAAKVLGSFFILFINVYWLLFLLFILFIVFILPNLFCDLTSN